MRCLEDNASIMLEISVHKDIVYAVLKGREMYEINGKYIMISILQIECKLTLISLSHYKPIKTPL